jgi:aryl-alcohol dehydrogenase-like predicted oxidoreductase
VGARDAAQATENAKAGSVTLSNDDLQIINRALNSASAAKIAKATVAGRQ